VVGNIIINNVIVNVYSLWLVFFQAGDSEEYQDERWLGDQDRYRAGSER